MSVVTASLKAVFESFFKLFGKLVSKRSECLNAESPISSIPSSRVNFFNLFHLILWAKACLPIFLTFPGIVNSSSWCPVNALPLISSTVFAIVSSFNGAPWKADPSITFIPSGITSFLSLIFLAKVPFATFVIFGESLSSVIWFNENAPPSTTVTESGNITFSSLFPLNADPPIYSRVLGNSTFLKLFNLNAFSSILLSFCGNFTDTIPFAELTVSVPKLTPGSFSKLNADFPITSISLPSGVLSGRTKSLLNLNLALPLSLNPVIALPSYVKSSLVYR